MTLQPPGNLQLEQRGAHSCRRLAGEPYQIIDAYGSWPEQFNDAAALAGAVLGAWRLRPDGRRLLGQPLGRPAEDWAQHGDHVLGLGDQGCALLQQAVAAL